MVVILLHAPALCYNSGPLGKLENLKTSRAELTSQGIFFRGEFGF